MAISMRETLDASINDAIAAKVLLKTRHGALMRAARLCADTIDAADEPSAAMLTAMLNYIRALGLAPSNEDIDRRRKARPKDDGMASMRAKFHAVG